MDDNVGLVPRTGL